jgi:hypothetical protein
MKISLAVATLALGAVTLLSGESIYDGTGSLINANQACWGCDRDEAMMHPHKNKNSTVTFQVLYSSSKCTHIDIHSSSDLGNNILINLKAWSNPSVEKSYNAKLPVGDYKYQNGVSLKLENWWTTVSISSIKPISKDISIYAYCRSSAVDSINNSDINEVTVSSTKLDNNHYHLGNGSLISTSEDNGQDGYGSIKDEAITSSNYNAETSFQVLSSKDKCEEVTIRDRDGSSKFEKILFKGWSEKDWKNSDCTKLPCILKTPLKSNGTPEYTLINIKTVAGENNGLYAYCGKKNIKFNLNEKENRPKHPRDCKFDDVTETHWGYKYITALCSSGILEGYAKKSDNPNYIPYSEYGLDDSTLWQELTKVVNLTDNFYKTTKIRSKYPEEPWGTAYVDIARKTHGFTEYSEMQVTRGLAFRYIVKVFWNKILEEEESASFLKSKNVIGNTNVTNYLTRAEMAKTVLRASRFSADESGLERKLPYINDNGDVDKAIQEKEDIPKNTFEKIAKGDSEKERVEKIERNRKKAVQENITFSDTNKNTTDNTTLIKKIVNIKKEYKDKTSKEIETKAEQEGIFNKSNELKENSIVILKKNDKTILGVTGERNKRTGKVDVTLENTSGNVNNVSSNDLENNNMKIKGTIDIEDIGAK